MGRFSSRTPGKRFLAALLLSMSGFTSARAAETPPGPGSAEVSPESLGAVKAEEVGQILTDLAVGRLRPPEEAPASWREAREGPFARSWALLYAADAFRRGDEEAQSAWLRIVGERPEEPMEMDASPLAALAEWWAAQPDLPPLDPFLHTVVDREERRCVAEDRKLLYSYLWLNFVALVDESTFAPQLPHLCYERFEKALLDPYLPRGNVVIAQTARNTADAYSMAIRVSNPPREQVRAWQDKLLPLIERYGAKIHPRCYQAWGQVEYHFGEETEALKAYEIAYAAFERMGYTDPGWKGDLLQNLGFGHYKVGNLQASLHYTQLALEIRRTLDPEGTSLAVAYSERYLGHVYLRLGSPRLAFEAFNRADPVLRASASTLAHRIYPYLLQDHVAAAFSLGEYEVALGQLEQLFLEREAAGDDFLFEHSELKSIQRRGKPDASISRRQWEHVVKRVAALCDQLSRKNPEERAWNLLAFLQGFAERDYGRSFERDLLQALITDRTLTPSVRLVAASQGYFLGRSGGLRREAVRNLRKILREPPGLTREQAVVCSGDFISWLAPLSRPEIFLGWCQELNEAAKDANLAPEVIATLFFEAGSRLRAIDFSRAAPILELAYASATQVAPDDRGDLEYLPGHLAVGHWINGQFAEAAHWSALAAEWQRDETEKRRHGLRQAEALILLDRIGEAEDLLGPSDFEEAFSHALQRLMDDDRRPEILPLVEPFLTDEHLRNWENRKELDPVLYKYLIALVAVDRVADYGDLVLRVATILTGGDALQWMESDDLGLVDWVSDLVDPDEREAARDLAVELFLDRARRPEIPFELYAGWRDDAFILALEKVPAPDLAREAAEQALEVRPEDPTLLALLDLFATAEQDETLADSYFERLLIATKATPSGDSPAAPATLYNVAPSLAATLWNHVEARLEALGACLANKSSDPDANAKLRCETLRSLAKTAFGKRDYARAAELYAEFVDTGVRFFTPSELFTSARFAANSFDKCNHIKEAGIWYERAMDYWPHIAHPEKEDWISLAQHHINHAWNANERGETARMNQLLDDAGALLRSYGSSEHELQVYYRRMLAIACRDRNDNQLALKHLRSGLDIAEANGNTTSRILVLNDMAVTFDEMGRREDATYCYEEALKLLDEDPSRSDLRDKVRNNFGSALRKTDDRSEEGIEILLANFEAQQTLPRIERDPSSALHLAFHHLRQNAPREAKTYLDESRAIHDAQGVPREAEARFSESRGFVWTFHLLGETEAARHEAMALKAACEQALRKSLTNADETEQAGSFGTDQLNYLNLVGATEALAENVLRTKGLVLENTLQLQAQGHSREDVQALTRTLLELELGHQVSTPEDLAQARERARAAERAFYRMENTSLLDAALATTVADVRAALPADGALLEFITLDVLENDTSWRKHYAVLVIRREQDPEFIDLGRRRILDTSIDRITNAINGALAGFGVRSPDEKLLTHHVLAFEAALEQLQVKIWSPIAAALEPGTTHLYLATEGKLAGVPFSVLREGPGDDAPLLIERFRITHLQSGRDLLHPPPTAQLPAEGRFATFANPDFGHFQDTWRSEGIPQLPSDEAAAAAIASRFKEIGWVTETFVGTEARELRLASLTPPSVLHFATHGYFIPPLDEAQADHRSILSGSEWDTFRKITAAVRSPMYRNGLFLAGVEDALDPALPPNSVSTRDDGILTAAEVGLLDLSPTFLVTLAACSSGAGDAVEGEGVFGLRRGFGNAGVQNLVATLWPVINVPSNTFYDAFYEHLLNGETVSAAHQAALLECLADTRKAQKAFVSLTFAIFYGAFIHCQLPHFPSTFDPESEIPDEQ